VIRSFSDSDGRQQHKIILESPFSFFLALSSFSSVHVLKQQTSFVGWMKSQENANHARCVVVLPELSLQPTPFADEPIYRQEKKKKKVYINVLEEHT